ncbi:hypothetical protein K438DRAFT_2127531 [Mycena galopus ATCC 62051]|nr:hypothetical protein K438DRAFT_2127531 [Mycena galopus ATCC 62051]
MVTAPKQELGRSDEPTVADRYCEVAIGHFLNSGAIRAHTRLRADPFMMSVHIMYGTDRCDLPSHDDIAALEREPPHQPTYFPLIDDAQKIYRPFYYCVAHQFPPADLHPRPPKRVFSGTLYGVDLDATSGTTVTYHSSTLRTRATSTTAPNLIAADFWTFGPLDRMTMNNRLVGAGPLAEVSVTTSPAALDAALPFSHASVQRGNGDADTKRKTELREWDPAVRSRGSRSKRMGASGRSGGGGRTIRQQQSNSDRIHAQRTMTKTPKPSHRNQDTETKPVYRRCLSLHSTTHTCEDDASRLLPSRSLHPAPMPNAQMMRNNTRRVLAVLDESPGPRFLSACAEREVRPVRGGRAKYGKLMGWHPSTFRLDLDLF